MIFDPVRKKWRKLTPEEWVRQNFIQYMIDKGKYPAGLISIENMFRFNKMWRRVDILVYNRSGKPVMIVECKSYDVDISDDREISDQIVNYNMKFEVPYIIITNGMDHYAYKFDRSEKKYVPILVIPLYEDLLT